jgi:hypothetical protein
VVFGDRTGPVVLCTQRRESLVGFAPRPCNRDAVSHAGHLGLFPGVRCAVSPLALTVWYLRRVGRWEEADSIEDASDSKGGMDSFRVMRWLSIGVVGPIAFFTLLAIPIHFSISDSEIRVGHYASFQIERFPLNEAKRLTIVDLPTKDVIVDFADGRRLRGSQVGDGGTSVRDDILQLLIAKTGLTPEHASTANEIPALRAKR